MNYFSIAAAAVVAAFSVQLVVDVAVSVSDADDFDDDGDVVCIRTMDCCSSFQALRLADYG